MNSGTQQHDDPKEYLLLSLLCRYIFSSFFCFLMIVHRACFYHKGVVNKGKALASHQQLDPFLVPYQMFTKFLTSEGRPLMRFTCALTQFSHRNGGLGSCSHLDRIDPRSPSSSNLLLIGWRIAYSNQESQQRQRPQSSWFLPRVHSRTQHILELAPSASVMLTT